MKARTHNSSTLYQSALQAYLKQGQKANLESAVGLGNQALADRLPTLDLAKLHESILVMDLLPAYPASKRAALINRAAIFFAAAISPEAATSPARTAADLKEIIVTLCGRTVQLAEENQHLILEVSHREKVLKAKEKAESELKKSEEKHLSLLEKANHLKEQLRKLSHRVLLAQEDERKKISRELHDVIAQELMGINVQLGTLKTAISLKSKGLNRDIAVTQKKVMKSAEIIHQFARELRPTALDDLGLTPALQSFMESFTERVGILTHLKAFAGVDKLNSARRTALYRVAQEALRNVARHANASRAEVVIRKGVKSVLMEVNDDGCSFDADAALTTHGNKRLGLLGMKERVEMIGGTLQIESSPGQGTKIMAQIPVTTAMAKEWELEAQNHKPKNS